MNVLVTGCAGFIGSRVCLRLLELGHTVTGVDNLNTAYDVRIKHWRLDNLRRSDGLTFVRMDVTDRARVRGLFSGNSTSGPASSKGQPRPIDAVVNLAARAGVRQSTEDPWGFFETNVVGTLNLLDACRESGVSKFVLASTSSLYGAVETIKRNSPARGEGEPPALAMPMREDLPTDMPLSPYAASKKAAEALCHSYHHLYDIDVSILRYFTVYGPAGRPDMSIFRFIRWIAEGEPLVLYGDGTQERDFTFVDDIAAGTVAALKPLGFEVVNLGGNDPVTLRSVITTLEHLLERKANVEHRPLHPADVRATWADISKAKRLLDWEPQTRIDEGLRRAVEWYSANRSLGSQLDLLAG